MYCFLTYNGVIKKMELMLIQSVSHLTGLSVEYIRYLSNKNVLPCIKTIEGFRVYRKQVVLDFIEERNKKENSEKNKV